MNFWGVTIKPNQPCTLPKNVNGVGARIYITQATLGDTSISGSACESVVQCMIGSQSFDIVSSLSERHSSFTNFEVNQCQDVVLMVSGPREVHLSGYTENSDTARNCCQTYQNAFNSNCEYDDSSREANGKKVIMERGTDKSYERNTHNRQVHGSSIAKRKKKKKVYLSENMLNIEDIDSVYPVLKEVMRSKCHGIDFDMDNLVKRSIILIGQEKAKELEKNLNEVEELRKLWV